jgi:fimbrial chaperone protein
MCRVKALVAFALLASSAIGPVEAQSLQVSPVTIDLPPGATSSAFTIETDSQEGAAIQARVFRWSKAAGEDKLDRTEDVVVSPPAQTVRAGSPSTLRLVRVAKTPVSGEETYRVVVDVIPDRKKLQAGTVALVLHQSFPVFFAGIDLRPGQIAWKAQERGNKLFIEATNTGQKRVKFTKLKITGDDNRDVLKIEGLAGYVLGGQTTAWPVSGAAGLKSLSIKAEGDSGLINASATVSKGG